MFTCLPFLTVVSLPRDILWMWLGYSEHSIGVRREHWEEKKRANWLHITLLPVLKSAASVTCLFRGGRNEMCFGVLLEVEKDMSVEGVNHGCSKALSSIIKLSLQPSPCLSWPSSIMFLLWKCSAHLKSTHLENGSRKIFWETQKKNYFS